MISPSKTSPLRDRAELLEYAHDAIILTDADGTITYWNHGAARIYGWESKEALGQKLHPFLHTKFLHAAPDPHSTLKTDSHWQGEAEQTRRDRTRIVVLSRWTIDGTRPDSPRLEINTDITQQKELGESAPRK